MNVTNYISSDFCIGCGVCVGVCPINHLRIGLNKENRFEVKENENRCIDSCNICLSVCPFSNDSQNEDDISKELFKDENQLKYDKECGFFINSYVGYAPDAQIRSTSASGGLTTYLLSTLLDRGIVDSIVSVQRIGGMPYFQYTVCTTKEELLNCTRSSYCAVEISEVIRRLKKDDLIQKVAIVALPCFAKAIRNACIRNTCLRKKVQFIFGLVCGQQKTHNYSRFLSKKVDIGILNSVDYRVKKKGRPNGNYGIRLNGKEMLTFSSMGREWSFKYMTIAACSLCDDIFAETADIAFMDAWLPEFKLSDKGENLVIVRSEELDNILKTIATVSIVDISKVIKSQYSVIKSKRTDICIPIQKVKKRAYYPHKREYLLKRPNVFERMLIATKYEISKQSDYLWVASGESYKVFSRKMKMKFGLRLFIGLSLNKINQIVKSIIR